MPGHHILCQTLGYLQAHGSLYAARLMQPPVYVGTYCLCALAHITMGWLTFAAHGVPRDIVLQSMRAVNERVYEQLAATQHVACIDASRRALSSILAIIVDRLVEKRRDLPPDAHSPHIDVSRRQCAVRMLPLQMQHCPIDDEPSHARLL